MELTTETHLLALFSRVAPVVDACVVDAIPALRCLMLVSKEASQVALQGMRSFSVDLRGSDNNTSTVVTSHSTQAHLQHLTVRLLLQGRLPDKVQISDCIEVQMVTGGLQCATDADS